MKTNKIATMRGSLPILVACFLMTACSLDIKETDSLLTKGESAIFNGVPDPGPQLVNIYGAIRDQTGDQAGLYALTEVTSDELLVPTRGTDWGDNGVWRTLYMHTYGPTHSYVVGVWNDKNSAVLKATQIIDPLTTSKTTLQAAQAKFARAYNMWLVMDLYGQVPFRNPSDGQDVLPSVMKRSEAYAMVVKDLTEAIADLPASVPASSDKFMPVKATARFLLAKVKLNSVVYNGSYGASDLQDVIDLVGQIEADGYAVNGPGQYFDTFVASKFTNTDVIWSVPAGNGNRMWDGLHYNQVHPDNGGGGWNGFSTLADFYDKFKGDANNNSISLLNDGDLTNNQEERRGYTHTLTTTNAANYGFGFGFQLGQMYSWKNGAAVALTNRTGAPLSFTKTMPGLVGNTEVTGMRLLKYSPANGAFVNGVVMARFADAMLMRAEANLRKGNTAAALTEVNALRGKRMDTPALGSIDLASLLDERGRELYTEGWRRNDLIRFGVYHLAKTFKPDEEDQHTYLFPIPSNALLTNPGLVQNPGY